MEDTNSLASATFDTIAALATPAGTAGLAVIRISGPDALALTDRVFRAPRPLREVPARTLHVGVVLDAEGSVIDEAVSAVFRAPHSYTGEDVVELSCHGGGAVSRAVLHRILEAGARHAEPGEFTRRAFLHGRIDLTQAEAVADLIHAESEVAHLASMRQLQGRLSTHVAMLRDEVIRVTGLLELGLDFVEEDVTFLSNQEVTALLHGLATRIDQALSAWTSGRRVRDGIKVVLVGAPNAGKSSLLNALLESHRAIVTDIPGTTRDYLEESLLLDGRQFRLVDTAGLRKESDAIEREGMERTRHQLSDADLILHLTDTAALSPQELPHPVPWDAYRTQDRLLLPLFTKSDRTLHLREWQQWVASEEGLLISVVTGDGLDQLRQHLVQAADSLLPNPDRDAVLITNARHADCLTRARHCLADAITAASEERGEECIVQDLRRAALALGEIIGEVTSDDILNDVFARFCIGK